MPNQGSFSCHITLVALKKAMENVCVIYSYSCIEFNSVSLFVSASLILALWPISCQHLRPIWIKILATTAKFMVKTIVHIAIMETWNTSALVCTIRL